MNYIIIFLTSISLVPVGIYITSQGGLFMISGIIMTIVAILQALHSAYSFINALPKKVVTAEEKEQKRIAKYERARIRKNENTVMESEISIMPSSLLKKNKELNKLGLTKKKKLWVFLRYFIDFYPTTFQILCLCIFIVIFMASL